MAQGRGLKVEAEGRPVVLGAQGTTSAEVNADLQAELAPLGSVDSSGAVPDRGAAETRVTLGQRPGYSSRRATSGVSPLIKDHLAGGASRLAALLLPQILPVFSVVAPCHPGAALRDLVLVQRRHATSACPARHAAAIPPAAARAASPVRRPSRSAS